MHAKIGEPNNGFGFPLTKGCPQKECKPRAHSFHSPARGLLGTAGGLGAGLHRLARAVLPGKKDLSPGPKKQ